MTRLPRTQLVAGARSSVLPQSVDVCRRSGAGCCARLLVVGVVAGLRVVFDRDARGDLRPALTSQRRSTAPVSGCVDGVAIDAPSPGVFAGQSYGNSQVREDAG